MDKMCPSIYYFLCNFLKSTTETDKYELIAGYITCKGVLLVPLDVSFKFSLFLWLAKGL